MTNYRLMKILLSPAKSLNYTDALPTKKYSTPQFVKASQMVHQSLKKYSPQELQNLMNISENLAQLNHERNQQRNYQLDKVTTQARPAIFAFNGDVYDGIDAYSLSTKSINYLQKNLRILSGLYGLLKPLDLIEAYRLEMGTKMPVDEAKNLYEFWQTTVTQSLLEELSSKEVVVNLASNEYFKVIDKKMIKQTIITPDFKDYKNGKLKTISFFAKKARGQMTRFIADNNLKKVEDIQRFNEGGYQFDQQLSTKNKWVFTR